MGEQILIKELSNLNIEAKSESNKNPDYDVILPKHNITIEVKNDIYSFRSGNIAVEYYNSKSNKPSGINSTKADFWCHIIKGEPYIVSVEELKKFIQTNQPLKTINSGGSGNADMYIYKIDNIIGIFIHAREIKKVLE